MANEIKAIIDPVAIGQLVSQACQSFELLERLHNGSVVLSPPCSQPEGIEDFKNTCQRALVMDFVILVARLHRLCTRSEDAIALAFPIHAIKKFSAAVEPIKGIRHANEHGLDVDARTKLKPEVVTHSIPGLGEFTMVRDQRWFSRVNGVPLIGNVELRPIYQATKEFEKVAGYLPAHKARDELFAKLRQSKEGNTK
jgi:hypothetical protein